MDDRHRHRLNRLVVVAMVVMVVLLSTSKARLICEQRFRSTIAIEPCLQVDINNCMEVSQRGRPGRSCIADVQDGRHCWEFFNCVVVSTTTATTTATTAATTTTHTTSTTTDIPTTTNAPTTHDIIDSIVGSIVGVLVLGLGAAFAVWWWLFGHLGWRLWVERIRGAYERFMNVEYV